ncbi:MAG: hypothetical protein ACI9J4_001627 [Paraglaciecola sp.]|jgi:hypothetical protein
MFELNKPISDKRFAVLMQLADLEFHSAEELMPLCGATPVRDVIKGLRVTHQLLIHGRGPWRLDSRHVNGDNYADLIARAEAKVSHANNSAALAVRESRRLSKALQKKDYVSKELRDIKDKTH